MTSKTTIRRIATNDPDFKDNLIGILDRDMLIAESITSTVSDILKNVRERGDEALLEYTKTFDKFAVSSIDDLVVGREQMEEALASIGSSQREALSEAAKRIRHYHEKQKQGSWQYQETDGSVYGQKVTPLERVGVYVPGGKANYPSSMLMLAVPAQVAGVKEIVATVPTQLGADGNLVFAAAALAGVSQVFTVGGAQAIAALAYGTKTISKVDKIAGPGNVYVAAAKKMVFGEVGIDMVAGPSELTIVCDGETDPDWIAMDMFSQAEHDEQAQSILISTDKSYIDRVQKSIDTLLPTMDRQSIIRTSLEQRGVFIHAQDIVDAADVVNEIAPEHLELSVAEPNAMLELINNAGAIFLGRYTAEALGDYCAGPSHVLPTSGTARFFSALGVYDFQKRSSVIQCSAIAAHNLAGITSELAMNEHLQAHALSAEYRIMSKK
jgi:histidinol dehydrogenase|tara:strand:- start:4547 stop:5863 length:1317 start_codon:yes stop_codon:yes gene_type:complete